ncbi:MAG: hypothetical protein ABIG61_02105 [Planctomycetota bacterium]
MVNKELRYKRIRQLVRKLNVIKRQQAGKIDILCNNIVVAQKDFLKKLMTLSFVVNVYEQIAGQTDLSKAVNAASSLMTESLSSCGIAVLLLGSNDLQVHLFDCDTQDNPDVRQFIDCFTVELVQNICDSNKLCFAEDMFAMGLQGNLAMLNKISFAAVPLLCSGSAVGLILVYRTKQDPLRNEELQRLAAITPGLAKTIRSCQAVSQTLESR